MSLWERKMCVFQFVILATLKIKSMNFLKVLTLTSAVYARRAYIVGGRIAQPHTEPHILTLQRHETHFCGASIISDFYGLSSAHCYSEPTVVTAIAGAHNLLSQETTTRQSHRLSRFTRHERYNSQTMWNDVAVIMFESGFELTRYVQPINLPMARDGEWMTEGEKIHLCGWGNIHMVGENFPSELHCVDTVYVKQSVCNSSGHYNGELLTGMFCAGELGKGGKAACQGDTGGPAVNSRHQQVGIVSWSKGCGRAEYPGVFTDVAIYRRWIDEIIL